MHRTVLPARGLVFKVLQIVGQDDGGYSSLTDGRAHCPVDQVANLGRCGCLLHKGAGHVLEHGQQIQLLLVMPAQRRTRLLADNGQHGHVIHPRIVEPGNQVRSARAGGGNAHA
ncbi:hypothetical protein D3C73_911100 [compost metagenome]